MLLSGKKKKVSGTVVSEEDHAIFSAIWKYPSLFISLKKVQL